MKIRPLQRVFSLVLVISLFVLQAVAGGQEHHVHDAATAPASPIVSPLIEEMVKLDAAFREVVSGVSLGDGARVHHCLLYTSPSPRDTR